MGRPPIKGRIIPVKLWEGQPERIERVADGRKKAEYIRDAIETALRRDERKARLAEMKKEGL